MFLTEGSHMTQHLLESLRETLVIVGLVTVMMVIVEFVGIRFPDGVRTHITGNPWNQYVFAALLGVLPGCAGAFMVVSLYVHGLVGFGALAAVMIATSGDEAFVMIAQLPGTALVVFALCFVCGVAGGFVADKAVRWLKLPLCQPCAMEVHEEDDQRDPKHFLTEHLWGHILKRHLPKLFAWIFVAVLALKLLPEDLLKETVPAHRLAALALATLTGIIPSSGPHMFFIFAFRDGILPFSALAANSIVQDGHALLPLLAFSVRDSVAVKVFNVALGLLVGLALLLAGS